MVSNKSYFSFSSSEKFNLVTSVFILIKFKNDTPNFFPILNLGVSKVPFDCPLDNCSIKFFTFLGPKPEINYFLNVKILNHDLNQIHNYLLLL